MFQSFFQPTFDGKKFINLPLDNKIQKTFRI
jgi:hypothetical protein